MCVDWLAYLTEGAEINTNAFTRSKAAGALRSLCATTIKNNPDDWPEWKIGRSVEEYTKFVLNSDSWGGEIEVTMIIARHDAFLCAWLPLIPRCCHLSVVSLSILH